MNAKQRYHRAWQAELNLRGYAYARQGSKSAMVYDLKRQEGDWSSYYMGGDPPQPGRVIGHISKQMGNRWGWRRAYEPTGPLRGLRVESMEPFTTLKAAVSDLLNHYEIERAGKGAGL